MSEMAQVPDEVATVADESIFPGGTISVLKTTVTVHENDVSALATLLVESTEELARGISASVG